MATKKKDDGATIELIGAILFIPFLIFSYFHFNKLKNKYMIDANSRRIVDSANIGTFMMKTGLSLFFIGYITYALLKSSHEIFGILLLILGVYLSIQYAKRLAAIYLGPIVNYASDEISFPVDMESYTITDNIKFRYITDLPIMDTVALSKIERITRQAGKNLYMHGQFGSRRISFSNKQKRDECIAAIQAMSGKKSVLQFEIENCD
jgi:hypothetical protein